MPNVDRTVGQGLNSRREEAAIHAALERELDGLEQVLAGRADGGSDTMSVDMARTAQQSPATSRNGASRVRTAAAQNAESGMGGSQLMTARDRGDYETQDQAVAAQVEETKRKPEKGPGALGNQTSSINFDNDDGRYVLSRLKAAAKTMAALAPDLAAQLEARIKRAEMGGTGGMGDEVLGGEPPSVANAHGDAGDAGGMGGEMEMGGEPAAEMAAEMPPGSDALQSLQEVARENAEAIQKLQTELSAKEEANKAIQDAIQRASTGGMPNGKAAARTSAPARPRIASGGGSAPDIKPGGGKMAADRFSFGDGGQYVGVMGDADDALAAEARESNDRPVEGESRDADSDKNANRDAGDYPHSRTAGRRAASEGAMNDRSTQAAGTAPSTQAAGAVVAPTTAALLKVGYIEKCDGKWCVYSHEGKKLGTHDSREGALQQLRAVEVHKREGSKAPANGVANGVAARPATAARDSGGQDLQPQAPTNQHGTYSGDEAGDAGNGEEIAAGTTPVLESDETAKVVSEANGELAARSRESTRGSATAARATTASTASIPPAATTAGLFTEAERKSLIKECEFIDGARDLLSGRAAEAARVLARGAEAAKAAGTRIASLQRVGDALEGILKREGSIDVATRNKLRKAAGDAVRLGRREAANAKREAGFIGLGLIEAHRARARDERVGPAFGLAIHQLQAGLLSAEELPTKVAEYMDMEPRTFEQVARVVEDAGNRAKQAAKVAARGGGARRIPTVHEAGLLGAAAAGDDDPDGLTGLFD